MNPGVIPDNNTCYCSFSNQTVYLVQSNKSNDMTAEECVTINGTLIGGGCETSSSMSAVFLLSIILFALTYVISLMLKDFKTSSFFPTKLRQIISDFAVVIAIASMSFIDNMIGMKTPKLYVPNEFKVFLALIFVNI